MGISEFSQKLWDAQYQWIMCRDVPGRGWCFLEVMICHVNLWYGVDERVMSKEGSYSFDLWHEAIGALNDWDGQGDPGEDWIKHKWRGGECTNPKKDPLSAWYELHPEDLPENGGMPL